MSVPSSIKARFENMFLAGNGAHKNAMGSKIIQSICDVFPLDISPQGFEFESFPSFESMKKHIAREIEGAFKRTNDNHGNEAILNFGWFLATDRQNPSLSLVENVCDILFLEREQRSEYVESKGGASPFKIRKLLLEYALFSVQIDKIIGELTKNYCAQNCDRLPVGCCSVLGYDLGIIPEVMLEAQTLEARTRGFLEPSPLLKKCRFHTDEGCIIALFKTPACVGFLCEGLIFMLEETYPKPMARDFVAALTAFRNCDIDRREVFEKMKETIEAGNRLLEWNGA